MARKSSMKQLPWVFLAVLGLIMASPVPAGAEDATTAQESDAPDPFAGMAEAEEMDVVEEEDSNDPFEAFNRFTSSLNGILRGVFLDPLADGYQTVTPEPVQDAISNAASNLVEPVSAASTTPVSHGAMPKLACMASAMLLDCTMLPMPKPCQPCLMI